MMCVQLNTPYPAACGSPRGPGGRAGRWAPGRPRSRSGLGPPVRGGSPAARRAGVRNWPSAASSTSRLLCRCWGHSPTSCTLGPGGHIFFSLTPQVLAGTTAVRDPSAVQQPASTQQSCKCAQVRPNRLKADSASHYRNASLTLISPGARGYRHATGASAAAGLRALSALARGHAPPAACTMTDCNWPQQHMAGCSRHQCPGMIVAH